MNAVTHTVDLAGIGPVEVTVAEYGSGQPFLLLHGGAGPQSVAGFAEKFAATHQVRVLVPTHPGFGGTARPEALAAIPALAALYQRLIDQLDLADVTVVGNSLGGWIAAEIALPATLPPAAQAIAAGNLVRAGDQRNCLFAHTSEHVGGSAANHHRLGTAPILNGHCRRPDRVRNSSRWIPPPRKGRPNAHPGASAASFPPPARSSDCSPARPMNRLIRGVVFAPVTTRRYEMYGPLLPGLIQ